MHKIESDGRWTANHVCGLHQRRLDYTEDRFKINDRSDYVSGLMSSIVLVRTVQTVAHCDATSLNRGIGVGRTPPRCNTNCIRNSY